MNRDRYNMQDTPESASEREDARSAAYEREIDRADYLRDEQRDRQMEEAMERDEASAAHLRSILAARPPRFFRETSTGMTWEFRNGKMTTDGEDSIFKSPAEIIECLDVIEVDADGNPLDDDADDIAGNRGDRAGKLQREEEA